MSEAIRHTPVPRRLRKSIVFGGLGLLLLVSAFFLRLTPFALPKVEPEAKPSPSTLRGPSDATKGLPAAYRFEQAKQQFLGAPALTPSPQLTSEPAVKSPDDPMKAFLEAQAKRDEEWRLRMEGMERRITAQPKLTAAATISPKDLAAEKARQAKEAAREAEEKRNKQKQWKPQLLPPRKGDREAKAGQVTHLKTPWSLAPTTVINCATDAHVSSDVPGAFRAYVTETVYDSATQSRVVLPQGTAILLKASRGSSTLGSSRMQVQSNLLSYRDRHIKLRGASVGDRLGTAGFADEIDRKWPTFLASMLVLPVLRSGSSLVGYGIEPAERVASDVAREASQQSTQQAKQFLRTEPTHNIRPSYGCSLLLTEPLELNEPLVES
jgi:type IV secretory pathway VirB10-like protein